MPRVSVVIPTYNRVDVLPRAIESVLSQSESDLELLIVDDGSTDDTQEFLSSYEDPRVRSVVHGTNRGANVARNTGIQEATGTYIAFLDSDDEWHPRKLERQLGVLESRSEEWVAAYCDYDIRVAGTGGRVEMLGARVLARGKPSSPQEGGEELMGAILADDVQPGAGSTLLVRTDIARKIGGFDESLDRFQDPEFVLRILREGNVAYVDEPLVTRYDTGSPDPGIVEHADEQYLEIYADQIDYLEDHGYDIRGSHKLVLAKAHLADGRFASGMIHLRDASVAPRHYPGLVWAAGGGARRRPNSVLGFCVLLTIVVFAWIALGS